MQKKSRPIPSGNHYKISFRLACRGDGVDERAIVGGRQAVDQDVVPGPIGNVKAMVNVVHRHSAFVEAIRKGQAHELETVAAPSETVMHMVAGVRAGREQAAIVIGGICRDRGNRR